MTETRSKRRTAPGFTLFELLIVLVILALALGVATPTLLSGRLGDPARAAALEVAGALRRVRAEAIRANRDHALIIDTERRGYRADWARDFAPLPAGLNLTLLTTRAEQLGPSRGAVRFFADGSSTGGGLTLSDDGSAYEVAVDWLTGRVRIARRKGDDAR